MDSGKITGLDPQRGEGPRSPRDKMCALGDVAQLAQQLRRAGRIVVQAHGTFDLLHLGHVRHLEAARRLGDVLIVTVTADRFVGKGPGRPVFGAARRAEMLAALACVDWVAINPEPDAVGAITAIRPHVYVKGQDYRDPRDDATGKITLERVAVEAHGGRLAFTEEESFSSSELINRHLDVFAPQVREQLDRLRHDDGLRRILALIESVRAYRVVLVGETIVDEYQYVVPMAKSPKESMIATRLQNRELFAGGVIAAANHVASFCGQVDVITALGERDSFEELIRESLKPNVRLHAIRRPQAPTIRKCRFVDPAEMRKLFEVYTIDDDLLGAELQDELAGLIRHLVPAADVTIACDFGHGLIAAPTVAEIGARARFLAVNAQSNSANMGFNLVTRYERADYVCIDAHEARLAAGDRLSPLADVARTLVERVRCQKIVVTQGRHGCVALERDGTVRAFPALAASALDTVGAGDAFLAVTAPLAAAGGSADHLGFVGNVAGALKVEIVGHRRSVEKPALVKAITSLLK